MVRQIVLLSHQGGSFVKKLQHAASQLGFDTVVVSSRIDNNGHVAGALVNAKVLCETDLTFSTVKEFIDTEAAIPEINGFISVWEGYRPLMAALNNQYGFNDISEAVAWRLRDKLTVRNLLRSVGLSETNALVASRNVLEARLNNRTRSFIKPRFGLGSVGTKELKTEDDLNYIQNIRQRVIHDGLLSGAVDATDFIVEDFIEGTEFSAELLVDNGDVRVLAYHEKVEVHYGIFTTTEPFCVSPPATRIDIYKAGCWLREVLGTLGATWGCYHVEFKVSMTGSFDLIEINPRVGGALIVESTNFIADVNILAAWMASISGAPGPDAVQSVRSAEGIRETDIGRDRSLRCSAFRVYFSESCGTVNQIKLRATDPMPSTHNVLVQPGQNLVREGAEQYLGDALWTTEVRDISEASKFQRHVQNESARFLSVDVRSRTATEDVFVIIDYNLNRFDEVISIAEKCYSSHGVRTVLMTQHAKVIDHPHIINALFPSVRDDAFIPDGVKYFNRRNLHCVAGLVFSDDALVTGSYILNHLGVWSDSPSLAVRSFDKFKYRESEAAAELPAGVARPDYHKIDHLDGDAVGDKGSWIIKPRCEGNNRGVVKVSCASELPNALRLNESYCADGLIAEQCIDIRAEYSVDGVGSLQFVTKKLSVRGRYPVEFGQVQPAEIDGQQLKNVLAASSLANRLTGQRIGAFHNEIMISDDSDDAYVVEPNRRPGGMQIWKLIERCYGVDLYDAWIHSAFTGENRRVPGVTPKLRCGILMLPGPPARELIYAVVLAAFDGWVDSVWQMLGIPERSWPVHGKPVFIAPEGFIFPGEPVDGHGFMLWLKFEAPIDAELEMLLGQFFYAWCGKIASFWDGRFPPVSPPAVAKPVD